MIRLGFYFGFRSIRDRGGAPCHKVAGSYANPQKIDYARKRHIRRKGPGSDVFFQRHQAVLIKN